MRAGTTFHQLKFALAPFAVKDCICPTYDSSYAFVGLGHEQAGPYMDFLDIGVISYIYIV